MKLALSAIRLDTLSAPEPSLDPKADFPAFPKLVAGAEYSAVTNPEEGLLGIAWIRPAEGGLFHCEVIIEGETISSRRPMHGSIVPYWFRAHRLDPNAARWKVSGEQRHGEQTEYPEAAAEEHESDPSAKVYLIQQGEDGPIKIGTSMDVNARLRDLQTANPYQLRLLKTLPGSESVEHVLHDLFAHLRLRGEWFKPGAELLAFAAEAQS